MTHTVVLLHVWLCVHKLNVHIHVYAYMLSIRLYTCPALPLIMRFIVEIIIFIGFRVVVRVGFRL